MATKTVRQLKLEKKLLSSGEVARLLVCTSDLVYSLARTGFLRGDRKVGAPGRMMFRLQDVHDLMINSGMSVDELVARHAQVALLVGAPSAWARQVADHAGESALVFRPCPTLFDAGRECGRGRVAAVVVDLAVGRGDAMALIARVRAEGRPVATAALIDEDEERADDYAKAGYDVVLRRPVAPAVLVEAVARKLGVLS